MTVFEPYRYLGGRPKTDWTTALQHVTQAAAKLGGDIYLAPGWYPWGGTITIADCDNVRFTGPGLLVYTGTTSPAIAIQSTTYTRFDGVRIYYNHPAFVGVLVQTSASPNRGTGVANLGLSSCTLSGRDEAKSAHALLDLDNSNIVRVLGTQFAAAHRGIRLATNKDTASVNVTIAQGCSFVGCQDAITSFLGSTLESLTVMDSVFEPRADGASSGIDLSGPGLAVSVEILRNWFGDRREDGGGPWVTAKARGLTVQGNRFGSAGKGEMDVAIYVRAGSVTPITLAPNVFDDTLARSVLVE